VRTATADLVLKAAAKALQDCADGLAVDSLTLEWASTLVLSNFREAYPIARVPPPTGVVDIAARLERHARALPVEQAQQVQEAATLLAAFAREAQRV
jgi:hypothetical protein